MNVPFDTIWEKKDGEVINKVKIRVSGITASSRALEGHGSHFGGLDWRKYKGSDLFVQKDGNTLVILGIYK